MVFNARSLRNKTFGVCEFLRENNCDACFITEAWIKVKDESIIAEIVDMGYEIKFKPRKGSKRGGGVCILFKPGLNISKCSTQSYKSFEVLQTTIKSSSSLIRMSTFYRTGYLGPTERTIFTDELDSYLESLVPLKGENILCGDFNIHVEDASDANTVALYSSISSYGYTQLVEGATQQAGGTLDLVFVQNEQHSNQLLKQSLFVHDICHSMTSDHNFIEFLVPFVKDQIKPRNEWRPIRNIRHIDIEHFGNDLKASLESPSVDFFNCELNDAVRIFNDTLIKTLDKHAPLIHKHFKVKRTPFTNAKLLSLRRLRRKFERRYRKYKDSNDLNMYKKLVNDVRECVKSSRNDHFRTDFSKSKGDRKQTFKVLNKMLGKTGSSDVLPDHNSEVELCNEFAKFFDTKVKNIRSGITSASPSVPYIQCLSSTRTNVKNFDEFVSLTDDDAIAVLNSLSSKQCEIDPIPTWLLKHCIRFLLPFICYIINTSLRTGVFPNDFKYSLVRPSVKDTSGDKNAFKNYRPISNLCFLSKFLEKCVLKQLLLHLDNNNLFNKFQSAYRRFHSCETAMAKITDDILNNLDSRKNTFLVFLDLSAAFDLVDHSILLNRLKNRFFIDHTVLDWFKSYLSDRNYSVKINCSISNGIITLYGVPQGSILGPILFLLYISEIESIAEMHGLNIHIFADDMQLYISFQNCNAMQSISTIENCLRHIKSWMMSNFLKINEDKTDLLMISPIRSNCDSLDDVCISFGGSIVLPSSTVTNLGVKIDSSMTFHAQINYITSKGYFYLNNFYRVADKLDHDLKVLLVTTYILPLIDYCNVVLLSATKSYVDKLQKLLNCAVRFIFNLRGRKQFLPITPYLYKLHILPVQVRIHYKLCLLVYKCINGSAPQYLSELLSQKIVYSSLRSSSDLFQLHVPIPTSKYGENAFSYAAPYQWNKLPQDIRLCSSIDMFKSSLKTYYFRQYFINSHNA